MNAFSPTTLRLIQALKAMPGIGRKSAQRLALHLLDKDRDAAANIQVAIADALDKVEYCRKCQLLWDSEICSICADLKRDNGLLCVVESPLDMMAIEESMAYRGRYFILNGKISPLDGIGPTELKLPLLQEMAQESKELVLAISPTVEGDATAHFIAEMFKNGDQKITRIAYGVPFGGELEYLDQQTLFHAFSFRADI
jgi:recombination protein RecR